MIFHSRSQPAAKKYGFWREGGGLQTVFILYPSFCREPCFSVYCYRNIFEYTIQFRDSYSSTIYDDRRIFLGFLTALFSPFLCTLLL